MFPSFVKKIFDVEKDKIIDENFIKGDFHFNEKGNKIIAEVLIDNFEKDKYDISFQIVVFNYRFE